MTTIGVFDSGVGGLTVLREMLPRFPGARFLYLGDTARLPYGSKSQETIARYAVSAARYLEDAGAEHLVIACNTASALALPEIRAAARVPVFGVIESGAEAAKQASRTGEVLVIGTEATVQSHAYAAALAAHGLRALEMACPLFVPLIEEGWQDHDVARQVARVYLDAALLRAQTEGLHPDTLLLGCTHYPLLRTTLREVLPPDVTITDAAACTADRVAKSLRAEKLSPATKPTLSSRPERSEVEGPAVVLLPSLHHLTTMSSRPERSEVEGPAVSSEQIEPDVHFFATDSVTRFEQMGSRFLGRPVQDVKHVRFPE